MSTKKIIILALVLVFLIGGAAATYYFVKGGFTKKQQYENCVADCKDLLILEGSKTACGPRCTEITGYTPEDFESDKQEPPPKNQTSTGKEGEDEKEADASTSETIDPNKEYYCEWVWPQKIIEKETKKVVKSCTMNQPWCYYADFKYENVGCCEDEDHTNCTTLPNLP